VCPLPAGDAALFEGPDGSMPITTDWCLAQRYEGAGERVLDWSAAFVDELCAAVASGAHTGSYNAKEVRQVADALARAGAAGSTGVVLGSEGPWVECLALNQGAAAVWTWEYSRVASTHPRLFAAPTREMAARFAAGTLPLMDWAVSFSSLEHSGLGRYGDAPNPEGDRDALEEAWCMLRPGATLALGVPMSCERAGRTEFNAHRVYGYARLAHVARGYELVGFQGVGCEPFGEDFGNPQPIVILRKPAAGSQPPALTADDFAAAAAAAAR